MQEKTKKQSMCNWTRIWLMIAAICSLLPASALIARAQEARPEPTEPPIFSRIRGTIRTCAGVGVPGIAVNIDGDFGSVTVVTNASGFYTATLEFGDYTVTPVPPTGYFFTPQSIFVAGSNLAANFTRFPRDNRANFDGDCRTDVSTFNRGSGLWSSINSSNGQLVTSSFGTSGDIATPGDFNADGKTDRAVFRPGNGTWYVRLTGGADYAVQWGTAGDIPVARDYDGDAKTDIAVFRPGNATWYIINSSDNSVRIEHFGLTGDRVVPGDYDGDGMADLAVFRPSDATWYIRRPDGNFYGVNFGVVSDWPAQADYDGDGKTDIAVFRPGNGYWYILNSSNGVVQYINWGLSGDRPVPGDYDGDGKADVAVQRPDSDAVWYIINSSDGSYTFTPFPPGEFPVPGGYLTPLY